MTINSTAARNNQKTFLLYWHIQRCKNTSEKLTYQDIVRTEVIFHLGEKATTNICHPCNLWKTNWMSKVSRIDCLKIFRLRISTAIFSGYHKYTKRKHTITNIIYGHVIFWVYKIQQTSSSKFHKLWHNMTKNYFENIIVFVVMYFNKYYKLEWVKFEILEYFRRKGHFA